MLRKEHVINVGLASEAM